MNTPENAQLIPNQFDEKQYKGVEQNEKVSNDGTCSCVSRKCGSTCGKFIVVPGAFNMTTGPAHWELLFRARALDNQVYTLGVAPARNLSANYVSYGNSLVVDPWGKVLKRMEGEEGILIEAVDIEKIDKIRTELPLLKHIRRDVYCLCEQE